MRKPSVNLTTIDLLNPHCPNIVETKDNVTLSDLINSFGSYRVKTIGIVGMDINGGIGLDDLLPKFPKLDMQWFKHNTEHRICIVGSKTYTTLPKLKNRKFIVVTRDPQEWKANNVDSANFENVVDVINNIEDAIIIGQTLSFENQSPEVMVIGGAEIYNHCIKHNLLDEVLVTMVNDDMACNKFIDTSVLNRNYGKLKTVKTIIDDVEMFVSMYLSVR